MTLYSLLDFFLLYLYVPTVDYVLPFIVIISIIVFIHEFGHYWVARRCGVKIEQFSIGFGREIFGWTAKSGTRWKVAMVPMGGYVKMFGDEGASSSPDAEKIKKMSKAERKVAFNTQPLPAKFAIVSAGPAANFILSILILAFFFSHYGMAESNSEVGSVVEDSAAQSIGLKPGDKIVELKGEKVTRFQDIQGIVSLHPNIEISIAYEREGKVVHDKITPRLKESSDLFGNKVKIGLIGISPGGVIHSAKLAPLPAIKAAVTETYTICVRTMTALGQMVTGTRSANELSGIARIAEYSGQAASRGMETILWFMAILSINLGLINLFPVPMLDGGHLFLYAIEAVRGRPLGEKTLEYCFRFGLVVLVSLMLFATFNDLKHFGIF